MHNAKMKQALLHTYICTYNTLIILSLSLLSLLLLLLLHEKSTKQPYRSQGSANL